MTPQSESEDDVSYENRLREVYRYRKVSSLPDAEISLDRDEVFDSVEGCLFGKVFRSSLHTVFHRLYVKLGSESISRAENEEYSSILLAFEDGIRVCSSGINKEALYLEVKSMAEAIEKQMNKIPPQMRMPVYDAQDPIGRLSVDRILELKKLFLETYFPLIGI